MRDHQRCAGFEAAPDLAEDAGSLFGGNEVQSQQTSRRIERSFRRDIDIALMQANTRGEGTQCGCGELQHLGRWIDSVEAPRWLVLRKHFELEAAAGADDQHPRILWSRLREQQHRHSLQISEAWHEARWALRVFGHCLWIGENIGGLVQAAATSCS